MVERPFMKLGTVAVFEKAEESARRGDAKTFDACLAELGSRKRGEELIEELVELREELKRPVSAPITKSFQEGDFKGFTVVTDNDCHARLHMLGNAKRSIWLSTYTLKDGRGELRRILAERVSKGVTVNLIVSQGPIKPGGHPEEVVEDLRASGVQVTVKTNHSKCVIVDEEHVMIGSSNLQDVIYRDVGVQFRSPSVAKTIIEYLTELRDRTT